MEVGPTTHYVMGGVRVDSDTQMSRIPGLSPQANAPLESMAPIVLVEIRFRIFWYSESARRIRGRIREGK